jgi:hypothetical protein
MLKISIDVRTSAKVSSSSADKPVEVEVEVVVGSAFLRAALLSAAACIEQSIQQ